MEHVAELQKKNSDVFELVIRNDNITFISVNDEEDAIQFDLIIDENHTQMSLDSTDGSNDINENYMIARYEYHVVHTFLHITHYNIEWTAYLKGTNIIVTTTSLHKNELQNQGNKAKLKKSLINLIESSRVAIDEPIYLTEECLDLWSQANDIANTDGEYYLFKLNEILSGDYLAEVHQENPNSDHELKFTKKL
jgi:hypothetical protein